MVVLMLQCCVCHLSVCMECIVAKEQKLLWTVEIVSRPYMRKLIGTKLPIWNEMVTWLITSSDPKRGCEAVRSAILATAWLLVYILFLVTCARLSWSYSAFESTLNSSVISYRILYTVSHCYSQPSVNILPVKLVQVVYLLLLFVDHFV